MILALAGGVGGAKLAHGLSRTLAAKDLVVVVNTGDDFKHLGLYVSPDLDTVIYTLAGVANPELGWGVKGETWAFMEVIKKLKDESWFQLGDRDLAVHVHRTRRLANGESLSRIIEDIAKCFGIPNLIAPMTDDSVRTICVSGDTDYAFQDYFVRLKCEPKLDRIHYDGARSATLSKSFVRALDDPNLEGIVICPSNPYLSIGPILAVADMRGRLAKRSVPAIAVSPIIAGAAVKGPAAKIMRELGEEPSARAVAAYYEGLIDTLVIDEADSGQGSAIRDFGIRPVVAPILMRDVGDRERLAAMCVSLIREKRRAA